jgi:hypothetical protein
VALVRTDVSEELSASFTKVIRIGELGTTPALTMLRRVALVRTDVSEELSGSFIKVTRIGELGTTLALTSQQTPFFIVTAVKTSNLTYIIQGSNAIDEAW